MSSVPTWPLSAASVSGEWPLWSLQRHSARARRSARAISSLPVSAASIRAQLPSLSLCQRHTASGGGHYEPRRTHVAKGVAEGAPGPGSDRCCTPAAGLQCLRAPARVQAQHTAAAAAWRRGDIAAPCTHQHRCCHERRAALPVAPAHLGLCVAQYCYHFDGPADTVGGSERWVARIAGAAGSPGRPKWLRDSQKESARRSTHPEEEPHIIAVPPNSGSHMLSGALAAMSSLTIPTSP